MNNHALTPEEWAQIPPEYNWFAVDATGSQYVYIDKPELNGWIITNGSMYIKDGPRCPEWQTSLQQRPQPAEQPTTPPTLPVTNIRVSATDFDRIAADFGLTVRNCGTYRDAAMYNLAGKVSIVFVCDVPTAIEFDDTGIELLVRTYEKIKIT